MGFRFILAVVKTASGQERVRKGKRRPWLLQNEEGSTVTSSTLEKGIMNESTAEMIWYSTHLDELPLSGNAKVMCTELLKIPE